MKKACSRTLAALAMALVLAGAAAAQVDLSVGGTAWYTFWEPAWRDGKYRTSSFNPENNNFREQEFDMKDIDRLGFPMYGGMLGMRVFNRVSLSGAFLYGRVSKKINCYTPTVTLLPDPGVGEGGYHSYRRDVNKWDVDTVVGVQALDFMSVITGFKAQGYDYRENHSNYPLVGGRSIYQKRKKFNKAFGPGLGLSFNIRLVDSLFLQLNATAIVLWGFENAPWSFTLVYRYTQNQVNATYNFPVEGRYLSYGGSSSLALAYQVPKTGLTLSLGFRYQVLRYRQTLHHGVYAGDMLYRNDVLDIFDGKHDHFYGLTFSAIYTFSFRKAKKE